MTPYARAQKAIADLKKAVYDVILDGPAKGLTNAEVGRMLGIYMGHKGHEGHISRTILSLLEAEGRVSQDKNTKRWVVKSS
ncbi:MAG: hypothetical protein ACOX4K_09695 [Bacillota bacterium]|jgi:hypothetical protein